MWQCSQDVERHPGTQRSTDHWQARRADQVKAVFCCCVDCCVDVLFICSSILVLWSSAYSMVHRHNKYTQFFCFFLTLFFLFCFTANRCVKYIPEKSLVVTGSWDKTVIFVSFVLFTFLCCFRNFCQWREGHVFLADLFEIMLFTTFRRCVVSTFIIRPFFLNLHTFSLLLALYFFLS